MRFLFGFFVIIILSGCAQQSSPTGGDKDTQPPIVMASAPPIFTKNYTGNEIVLEFDEYIQVKDFSSQLIVSPSLENAPEYKLRGKQLIISWDETLNDSTTYQFNFGKSVSDLNEGNIITDLVFVFSTGSYIDSLSISGQVVNVADNTPSSPTAVMIYSSYADSLPLTTPPEYFALTDEFGFFKLNYLPTGYFKIFALNEENNNYIYDGPPETIGFTENLVQSNINDSLENILLAAFIENDTSQYIASTISTDYGFYELVFNARTEDLKIEFIDVAADKKLETINYLNKSRDSLKCWVKLPTRSSLEEVLVIINDGNSLNDSLYWYLETDPKYSQKAELKLSSNTTREKIDRDHVFTLKFNNPIVEVDTSIVFFLEDSIQVFPNKFERSGLNREVKVFYDFNENSNYIFKASAGAFKDLFESYNDSVSIAFSLHETDYYGHLLVNVALPDSLNKFGPKVLQLLDDENNVLNEVGFKSSLYTEFRQLDPGKYRLKVIFDENNNGKWDTGSYKKGIQPEKVSFYPDEIKIRSNWDFEVEWTPMTPFD